MKKLSLILFGAISLQAGAQQIVADFEDFSISADTFVNGEKGDTLIIDNYFHFPIIWDTQWSFWAGGWALSNQDDSTREDTDGLYQSITGEGYASPTYLVGQQGSSFAIDDTSETSAIQGLYITNTAYTYSVMLNGNNFAKKFGGATGNDPDYLYVEIRAKAGSTWKDDTVRFYLADFRSSNSAEDNLVSSWEWVDLSIFGVVDSLSFELFSSDTGQFGINTPTFFAIDRVTRTPATSVKPAQASRLSAYPNPVYSTLYLENVGEQWMLFNQQGSLLKTGGGNTLDASVLPAGLYYLRDETGKTLKIIKQ